MSLLVKAVFGTCAAALLTAQAPAPDVAPTPVATVSADCPKSAVDTRHFLSAPTYAVRAPRGELALVAVRDERMRARGLMCVVRVPRSRGMLFVFPPPDRLQGFWMKNTLVGLDMIFVNASGIVTTVAAGIAPTPAGTPDDAVARRTGVGRFVIELGSGDAARHGIRSGTQLQLPAIAAQ